MKLPLFSAMLAAVFFSGTTLTAQFIPAEPWNPPPEQLGDWSELRDQFLAWKIAAYRFRGGAADGGSEAFDFSTVGGEEFSLLVASSGWWTKEDRAAKRQPVFLGYQGKYYKIHPRSEVEGHLIEILEEAATGLSGEGTKDPRFLSRLRDLVNGPIAAVYDGWPLEPLEVSDEEGEWSTIEEQVSAWEISDFEDWTLTVDSHIICRFDLSDESTLTFLIPHHASALNYRDPINPLPKLKPGRNPFLNPAEPPRFSAAFLHIGTQLFCIEKGSEAEKTVIEILDRAAANEGIAEKKRARYISPFFDFLQSRDTGGLEFLNEWN